MATAFSLLDEINLLHDYYRFRMVELQINSHGGEVGALRYLVDGLRPWRNGKRVLKTVAVTDASSAAAILLSLGTLGHRYAASYSQLLYHPARRIYGAKTSQTGAELKLVTQTLDDLDKYLADLIIEHVSPQIPVDEAEAYAQCIRELLQSESFILPSTAKELHLIDGVLP